MLMCALVTCLTVGSRGDVQPYIALCCGLMKENHKCRIASHPEYQSWVESYGIEFRSVGGDPAELMRSVIFQSVIATVLNQSGFLQDMRRERNVYGLFPARGCCQIPRLAG